jgi:hypothetical protein
LGETASGGDPVAGDGPALYAWQRWGDDLVITAEPNNRLRERFADPV